MFINMDGGIWMEGLFSHFGVLFNFNFQNG